MLTIMTWEAYTEAWKDGEYGLAIILFLCIFLTDLVTEGYLLASLFNLCRGAI